MNDKIEYEIQNFIIDLNLFIYFLIIYLLFCSLKSLIRELINNIDQ